PPGSVATASVGETGELRETADGHDARHDRNIYPGSLALLDECEIRVDIIEILRDGTIGPRFDLAFETGEIVLRRFGLRVVFRVGSNFYVECIPKFRAKE